MLLSENWLREWASPELDTAALAEQVTMAGLEVDAVNPVAGEFSGVVVAEITGCAAHPDAEKLRVCEVNAGSETVQIVCGAPNARVGIKVPLATVDAVLPGNFKIKKAKLRGVESFGMLCAEEELGMAEKSDGLFELPVDAPVGEDIRSYLGLDDQIIEVDLTPNRSDCLSIRGIARDVAALTGCAFNAVEVPAVAPSHQDSLAIAIAAEEDCPRYTGRIIRGVDISKPTPLWMVEKLRRSGIRSIDPVVDVTNYVLLELGQPLHAFDLAKLDGGITIRKAAAEEAITLLDGQELKLRDDTLVIADDSSAQALAGIMGGEASAVSASTQDIFLESAFFAPEIIAGRARSYGLHTDSSHRFERGVDYELPAVAIERATALLLDIVGGEAGPVSVVDTKALPQPQSVQLRAERIEKMLGLSLSAEQVEAMLSGLGFDVTAQADNSWQLSVPSWRFDVSLEVDLLEELARLYGYNRLPVKPIQAAMRIQAQDEKQLPKRNLRQYFVSRGYQEAITYSFVDPALRAKVEEGEGVALLNPISSELSIMRGSLFTGLLAALQHNVNRQQQRLRLFETGLRFDGAGDDAQTPMIGGVIYGKRGPDSWHKGDGEAEVDFYDLKGDVEGMLALNPGVQFDFVRGEHKALHPGQTAEIHRDGKKIGVLGKLHPALQADLGLPQGAFLFEMELAAVSERALPSFAPLSKFPEVKRDLAVLVAADVAVDTVLSDAKAAAGEHLTNLKLFDIYQGKGVDTERKSLAFSLTFQSASRTLNDDEVNDAVASVVTRLVEAHGAELRN